MRRPGYLRGFGVFGGKYFEVLDERSDAPIYVIKDRIQTNTAEEFGSKNDHSVRVTINPRGPRNYDFLLFRAGAPMFP